MSDIVTITMNPALDKSSSVPYVVADEKLRCTTPKFEPGGGGVNASRAIGKLGGNSTCILPAGGPTGDKLVAMLREEGVETESIDISEGTRENLVIFEEKTTRQYRFGMPGSRLSESEWQNCISHLLQRAPEPGYVVASGSLPPGVPDDFYRRIADELAETNTRFILDTSGEPLKRAVGSQIFLIKPNIGEFQNLVGETIESESAQIETAQRMIKNKGVQNIVISLGTGGAILVTEDDWTHFHSPSVPIKSRVGAGDSMVAGTTYFLSQGRSLRESVRYGVSAGAAAVMTPGTELCRKQDVEEIYRQMESAREDP